LKTFFDIVSDETPSSTGVVFFVILTQFTLILVHVFGTYLIIRIAKIHMQSTLQC